MTDTPSQAPKTSKNCLKNRKPPLDFFGKSPTFYMNGLEKTRSWAGCFCTFILAGSIAAVTVIYSISFLQNKDKNVYSIRVGEKKYPLIDLAE